MGKPDARIVIVGGARCGKSTLARQLRADGIPTFCGDPLSTVKEPEQGVTYLPEGLDYSGPNGGAQYVATHWLTMPGPWVLEGHVMARALRRKLQEYPRPDQWRDKPRIIVFSEQWPGAVTKPGQVAQHKGVMSVWQEIQMWFPDVEWR